MRKLPFLPVLIGVLAVAFATPAPAQTAKAEGPDLPPAEYKGLPEGTKVEFRTEKGLNRLTVTRNEGYEYVYKIDARWDKRFALFGRTGSNGYTPLGYGGNYSTGTYDVHFDEAVEAALASLWPLEVGNSAAIKFKETDDSGEYPNFVLWEVDYQVVRTELVELNGKTYSSYLIRERARGDSYYPLEYYPAIYTAMHWYNPDAGLILKSRTEDTRGPTEYNLVSVTFPEGTATHVLRPLPDASVPRVAAVPTVASPPSTISSPVSSELADEMSRLKQEAERLKRETEMARLKQELELARLKQEAEMTRFKQEAEMTRLKQEAERAKRQTELERVRRETELANLQREDEASSEATRSREREADERRLWASVKDSRDPADLNAYLARHPDGKHTTEAQARLKVLDKFASISDIRFGNYHALVIGNNDYENLPKLETAIDDAKAVAEVLERNYGFTVRLMLDVSAVDIVDAFDELRETLTYEDNLLIYYAGHGWLDEESGQGYWMPVDAKPNRRSRWVSNSTLKDTLRTLSAKHVIVVADSCFSGTLVRGASVGIRGADYWRKMAEKQTRVAITSGGLEPVADAESGGSHSPFAKAFIEALRGNDVVVDGTTLFNAIRRPVMLSVQQTPVYSDVRGAGHEGGDFLFVRRN